jgi:ketosteroid isomerase-like protein
MTNKQIIRAIWDELARGNTAALREALAEDITWTMKGTTRWSGTFRGRRAVLEDLFRPLFERFADRYTNTADRLIADGDLVVVECRGHVTTREGAPYHNHYCWICRLDGGRIVEITEYMDTALVAAVL